MNLATANKRKPSIHKHGYMQFLSGAHKGILACTAVVAIWFPALFTYFSQDDFTHLLISRVDGLGELWRFFIPVTTAIFYRPLSIQLSTWAMVSLFGLRPFW